MGEIIFKVVVVVLLVAFLLFIIRGDRRIRQMREVEERAALDAEERRRAGVDSGSDSN